MGDKGDRLTGDSKAVADTLVDRLALLGDVSSKTMFGGVGIFESGTMFGIVDSKGGVFLRGDAANAAQFEAAGSERHGKMPYFSVPDSVLADPAELARWGRSAVEVSRSAKKG